MRRGTLIIYVIAGVQAATCVGLGVLFIRNGSYRLAIAQFAYAFTTIVLFAR